MIKIISHSLSVLFLLWPFAVACEVDYRINVSESIATTNERQRIEQFLNQVYAPLNIQPEYVYYPSQRGLPLVNTGEIDAEAARYEFTVKEYQNLIQVPETLGTISTVVLCSKEQNCQLSPNRTVGVLQGFLMAKEFCLNEDKLCYFTENPSVLAKLLDSQRVDAILVRRNQIPSIVCNSDNNDFYAWHFRDFDLPTHHYVHRDNEHLVDALANSIREQKNTSIYLQITQQWLARAQQCGKTITSIPLN